jgi:hypothetical protein
MTHSTGSNGCLLNPFVTPSKMIAIQLSRQQFCSKPLYQRFVEREDLKDFKTRRLHTLSCRIEERLHPTRSLSISY